LSAGKPPAATTSPAQLQQQMQALAMTPAAPELPQIIAGQRVQSPAAQPQVAFDGIATAPAAPAAAGLAGGAGIRAATDDAQRLQPQGRISLAVDFPTEGRVLHFKKVKANADLRLSTVRPDSFARWKALGWALCLAAAFVALRYAIAQRQRKRRIAWQLT
jgi:hypothetical protein